MAGHLVQFGRRKRRTYARINEVLGIPNLIEIQQKSYEWFLEEGLREMFQDISPIQDFTGNLVLEFIDYSLGEPKYSVDESKERDVTYAAPLRVKVRLINKETGEVKEQEVFMGDFPIMTDTGTFIINGAERVIVSQLVRSPSVYYSTKVDKNGKKTYTATVIPNRGAWLELETDAKDIIYVRIDRTRKIPVTVLLRSLGFGTDAEILDLLGDNEYIRNTLDKDNTDSTEKALIEIYERLRPGEPPTLDNARSLIVARFFDPKRYDLANVGRYKINKKLHIKNRLFNQRLAETLVDSETGEIIAEAGQLLDRRVLDEILPFIEKGAGYQEFTIPKGVTGADTIPVQCINVYSPTEEGKVVKVISNGVIDKTVKNITPADIISSINYFINLLHGIGNTDDIDHLGNRRLRSVGELLQNQFRIGLSRMERVVRERMSIQDANVITPQALINIRPVIASIKEFFGSSQLSQFMDQTNPLAELTHKRRLSALGPGGLTRERAGMEVRDVHHSHYGRMCPIETPEGPNIGLINSLSTFARINEYGFIEAPYRWVDPKSGLVTDQIAYLTADEEDNYVIAQANAQLTEDNKFVEDAIIVRYKDDNLTLPVERVDYMDVSPKQVVSVATALIPFLENDDSNRALMGSNMQRQAVPLLIPKAPLVGTGMEHKVAKDSGVCIVSKFDGIIEKAAANEIWLRRQELVDGKLVSGNIVKYKLHKFMRSNQGTCINQRPIVKKGQLVKAGDILADGPSTEQGELALGA
ncbi:DNA-directed RNA polymerase beta subunit [Paenibacillus sp. V4I3]|nr:DNA-directed RNA polymerase beta subunit [Paenibacillus sp. V4I3]